MAARLPRDTTAAESSSEPAAPVKLTVRSRKEAEKLVADAAHRWAGSAVDVDVPGVDCIGDAAMVLASLLPMAEQRGWAVYSTRELEEAYLLCESLNDLWWDVSDVAECVLSAVEHLRGAGAAAAAEDQIVVVDGGEGAVAPDHAAMAAAGLRRAREAMREVMISAAAEALQFALDGMGDGGGGGGGGGLASRATLTSALLDMRTRVGKHCGLALFTSNMNPCRDMAVLVHEITEATGVALPLSGKASETASTGQETAAAAATTEARIENLERVAAAVWTLLDAIDHMRKAPVSFDLPAHARAPPRRVASSSRDAGEDVEEE